MTVLPTWLTMHQELAAGIRDAALQASNDLHNDDPNLIAAAQTSLLHFLQSLETTNELNRRGRHALAIGVARHCVESLTVFEVGLQSPKAQISCTDRNHRP